MDAERCRKASSRCRCFFRMQKTVKANTRMQKKMKEPMEIPAMAPGESDGCDTSWALEDAKEAVTLDFADVSSHVSFDLTGRKSQGGKWMLAAVSADCTAAESVPIRAAASMAEVLLMEVEVGVGVVVFMDEHVEE